MSRLVNEILDEVHTELLCMLRARVTNKVVVYDKAGYEVMSRTYSEVDYKVQDVLADLRSIIRR